jgi:hypothetical protein
MTLAVSSFVETDWAWPTGAVLAASSFVIVTVAVDGKTIVFGVGFDKFTVKVSFASATVSPQTVTVNVNESFEFPVGVL